MSKTALHIRLLILLLCAVNVLFAQTPPGKFRYQSIIRDATGDPLSNQALSIRIGIFSGSPAGTLEWEETHAVTTDQNGLYVLYIGSGTSTAAGATASFSLINWANSSYYIKIEADLGSGYTNFGTTQFFSVPYAFYSAKTGQFAAQQLNDLQDADTANVHAGQLLKWDGSNWKPAADNASDTVSFAFYAVNANHVDSATYALNIVNAQSDTVAFSYQSDSSAFSTNSGSAATTVNSVYSDTATYAQSYLPYNWSLFGNTASDGQFIGTAAGSDLVFKTTALERMRIAANGNLSVGLTSTIASVHFSGVDGFMTRGAFGSGILADSSLNTRLMWYPKKASIRIGEIASNRWNDGNIGDYSFASGYNTQASGLYSIAMGYNSVALNENCISIGRHCTTNIVGVISGGGCVALGDSCTVASTRSLAMGYKNRSDGGIVMGYKNRVYWASQTSVWGANNYGAGDCSIVFGSNASSNGKSCFVFSDSSGIPFTANVNYQFKVRASGGVIFYSDPTLTSGVQLFPGGGAWASVSDRNKKENFKIEDPEEILAKIMQLSISTWNYKSQGRKIRHAGPMAQDFYAAFAFGEDNRSICTVDMDGVILLGIKALAKRTSALSETLKSIDELRTEVKKIDDFTEMENRISEIEKTFLNKK